jgi:hypothetical protein
MAGGNNTHHKNTFFFNDQPSVYIFIHNIENEPFLQPNLLLGAISPIIPSGNPLSPQQRHGLMTDEGGCLFSMGRLGTGGKHAMDAWGFQVPTDIQVEHWEYPWSVIVKSLE